MKIRPVGAQLFHAEANSRFPQFWERTQKKDSGQNHERLRMQIFFCSQCEADDVGDVDESRTRNQAAQRCVSYRCGVSLSLRLSTPASSLSSAKSVYFTEAVSC